MSFFVEDLAQYVADLRYEDIPSATVESAKKCILDSAANMLCGRYTETGRMALEYLETFPTQSGREATLIGGSIASLEQVIFAHTVMARCADLDDGSRRAMGHPGCVLVPVVLAVAEAEHRTGREAIAALVAGYDLYVRTGSAINPTSYKDRGFDATGLCGAVAAAGAVSKLMGGNREQIRNAIGLAALFCGGLIEYQNDGTMGKTLCGAWAGATGLRAAQLAKIGFTGPDAAFEGKKAFMQAFSNAPNGDFIVKDLGKYFCINEVYFKLHACMRGLHSAIDAILRLRNELDLTPDRVREIIVWTTPFVERLSNPTPETIVGAQCSLQFTMATAIQNGNLGEEKLLVDALQNEQVRALAKKIRCERSEELQAYVNEHPSHWSTVCVEVETTDGARQKATVHLPTGEPENPLSWADLTSKLIRMTKDGPLSSLAAAIPVRIEALEEADLSTLWH